MNIIEQFHVMDFHDNLIEIAYHESDPSLINIIMCKHRHSHWLSTLGGNIFNHMEFIPQDTFIESSYYSVFELEVYKIMAATNNEIAFTSPYVNYNEFLEILSDLNQITFDSRGTPYFI